MKEEIEKLDEMINQLQNFTDYVFNSYKSLTREVVLTGMIVKKTMDILDTAKYTLKNYIISTQISLLRLLCDNCLALQSVREIGIEKYLNMLTNHVKVNTIMIDDEQNMSDGYLKKLVAQSYFGFDRLYNFACEGVHFSSQALSSAFSQNADGTISSHICVGNKELKTEMISNNAQMITLCKVIMDMLKKICIK